jgi:hypothetical protein
MPHLVSWCHSKSRLPVSLAAATVLGISSFASARPDDGPCQTEKQVFAPPFGRTTAAG